MAVTRELSSILASGPVTGRELQRALRVSQSALSRRLRDIGDQVLTIRSGRSIWYALAASLPDIGHRVPIYRFSDAGDPHIIGYLRPMSHGGFFIEATDDLPSVYLGEQHTGTFEDLPYFLDDMRPQGFLGRQIARALAQVDSDYPDDPRNWQTRHVLQYLLANGLDLPGDLVLGESNLLRLLNPVAPIDESQYPTLANAAIEGRMPGSSAGGEQPKFTAFTEEHGHVIVKFSPAGNKDTAQRWRYIMQTEHTANDALRAVGLPAANTRLIELGDRLYLESERFDRVGETGRRSMLSLSAIDAEFVGMGENWVKAAQGLHDRGLIDEGTLGQVAFLWHFGRAIHNSDMHLGNLSFAVASGRFELLPAYDMCSMRFAPDSYGEMRDIRPVGIEDDVSELVDINRLREAVDRINSEVHN